MRDDRANQSEWIPLKHGQEGLPILGGNPFLRGRSRAELYRRKIVHKLFGGLTLSCSRSAKSPAFPWRERIRRVAPRFRSRNNVPAQMPRCKTDKPDAGAATARACAADTWTPPIPPIQSARSISCICSKDRCTSHTSQVSGNNRPRRSHSNEQNHGLPGSPESASAPLPLYFFADSIQYSGIPREGRAIAYRLKSRGFRIEVNSPEYLTRAARHIRRKMSGFGIRAAFRNITGNSLLAKCCGGLD